MFQNLLGNAVQDRVKAEVKRDFFSSLPVQVGPPTQYASTIKHWMHFILILQAVGLILRVIVLLDIFGSFWMFLLCGMGWYAWYQEMNISYVTVWGIGCALNGFFDTLGFIIPTAVGMLKIELLSTCVRVGCPLSELLGALFAWHVYRDYQAARGAEPVSKLDPLGPLFTDVDPESIKPFAAINAAGTKAEHFLAQEYSHMKGRADGAYGSLQGHNPFQTSAMGAGGTVAFSEQGPVFHGASGVPGRQQNNACC
eukprot:TRINITY_DN96972_c0_g1_i1.p1 TRINITY_DN96972_c0_g1~~TRINITY_DN96972_c0_g1_i1.p1  ORF type:complete len:254 (-),score=49.88 TRINITY_DN96972_c0_g1_i1:60-821(-)